MSPTLEFLKVALDGFATPLIKPTIDGVRRILSRPDPLKQLVDGIDPARDSLEELKVAIDEMRFKQMPFPPLPENATLSRPTPDEISDQIAALPPYQKRGASDSYEGLTVCWSALFRDLRPLDDAGETWNVDVKYFNPGQYSSVTIDCYGVRNPRVKSAERNSPVIVRGTIADARWFYVAVVNASIQFL